MHKQLPRWGLASSADYPGRPIKTETSRLFVHLTVQSRGTRLTTAAVISSARPPSHHTAYFLLPSDSKATISAPKLIMRDNAWNTVNLGFTPS